MFEIVYHPDFGELNEQEQPKPIFETYETPLRCESIWNYLGKIFGFNRKALDNKEEILLSDQNILLKKPTSLDKDDIELVHTKYHIELVQNLSDIGSGQIGSLVMATEDTFDLALLSAGGVYTAIFDVINGKSDQSFAIVRPPGHHALPDCSDGLCVFNNIAIAIHKLRKHDKFKGKIAIIDIDAHFGDGISKIFYEDNTVFYSSVHEYDYMTGEAGSAVEIGLEKGRGYNFNYPIPLNADGSYLNSYIDVLTPIIKKFSPEIIIVAAGFDGHWADPIGNLCYNQKDYCNFAKKIHKLAKNVCNSKIAFCLEGGYNLIMIPRLIEGVISEFIKHTTIPIIDSDIKTGRSIKEKDYFNSTLNEEIRLIQKRIMELL